MRVLAVNSQAQAHAVPTVTHKLVHKVDVHNPRHERCTSRSRPRAIQRLVSTEMDHLHADQATFRSSEGRVLAPARTARPCAHGVVAAFVIEHIAGHYVP